MKDQFNVGDKVEMRDGSGTLYDTAEIMAVRAKTVITSNKQRWDLDGRWWDGSRSWPFPYIQKEPKL